MSLPSFIPMLGSLIATPTISSADASLDISNRPLIDVLANWLDELGFSVKIQTVSESSARQKVNLIATIGQGDGGLVLAGHTDTVPYDSTQWHTDPFALTDRDHRFYGLGTTDMKGFFAVVLEALKSIELHKINQPLIILATADEESSMSGARALSKADFGQARHAIIGEPTGLTPIHLHKGVMMESIRLEGRSGHSSDPSLGISALDAMYKVIGALMALRQEWALKYQNPAFDVEIPTMNLAKIHGGDATNRICHHCQLEFDVRLLPGMGSKDIRHIIRHCVDQTLQETGISASHTSLFEGIEAFNQDRDSDLVRTVETMTGKAAGNVAFATEAPFLQSMGMQTIVLGPGSIDCAHQANEFLAQDQINPAIELTKKLIHHYCF